MIRPFQFQVAGVSLEYDRDYGIDRRSGWSGVVQGHVVIQFVSLPRAVASILLNLLRIS